MPLQLLSSYRNRGYQVLATERMTGEIGAKSNISIVATFTTPQSEKDVEHRFDESNCQVARIGLPQGVEAVKVSTY